MELKAIVLPRAVTNTKAVAFIEIGLKILSLPVYLLIVFIFIYFFTDKNKNRDWVLRTMIEKVYSKHSALSTSGHKPIE